MVEPPESHSKACVRLIPHSRYFASNCLFSECAAHVRINADAKATAFNALEILEMRIVTFSVVQCDMRGYKLTYII